MNFSNEARLQNNQYAQIFTDHEEDLKIIDASLHLVKGMEK